MRFITILILLFISCNNNPNDEYLESLKNPKIYPFGIDLSQKEVLKRKMKWPNNCPSVVEIYTVDSKKKLLSFREDCTEKDTFITMSYILLENGLPIALNTKYITSISWTEDEFDWGISEQYCTIVGDKITEIFFRDTIVNSQKPDFEIIKNKKFIKTEPQIPGGFITTKIFWEELEKEINRKK